MKPKLIMCGQKFCEEWGYSTRYRMRMKNLIITRKSKDSNNRWTISNYSFVNPISCAYLEYLVVYVWKLFMFLIFWIIILPLSNELQQTSGWSPAVPKSIYWALLYTFPLSGFYIFYEQHKQKLPLNSTNTSVLNL
jgi:hypothetical protein